LQLTGRRFEIELVNKQRIGIYGGTFDPIHEGHLKVAGAILEAFELDRMLFVPASTPPHKRKTSISSSFHRFAMLALATADEPRMAVSSIELETPDRPYTIDTLTRLQTALCDAKLFFVMGADSFRDIQTWREYERILTEFDCIVAARPGTSLPGTSLKDHEGGREDLSRHLARELQAKVIDLRGQDRSSKLRKSELPRGTETVPEETFIYLTDFVTVDISAWGLREAITQGKSIGGQTPASVVDYIDKYRLYQESK
jgi:nicotinate-nucleotide adenylyltransferase